MRSAAGFTLVELMMVTVIIGILAMIAATKFGGVRDRAMLATVQSDLRSAMRAVDLFQITNGDLPSTLAELEGLGFRRTAEVRFCVFQPESTPSPHVHIEATHRRVNRALITRHPLWAGRMDEVEGTGCEELGGGAAPPGPGTGPPGQGGTPPGQGGTPPGQGGTPPGQGGGPPGGGR